MGDDELFEVNLEDYYSRVNRYTVTASALKTLGACRLALDPNRLYTTAEIREAIYPFYKRTIFGAHSVSADLHNLWRCKKGGVRKFAKGIYVMSRRPYGTKWQVSGD